MISNIVDLIKLAIYCCINILISSNKNIKQGSLLLIRLDAIGDYVLFRNFIKILKTSPQYKDYSITLVGNSVWKTLSMELDNDFIDNFIWVDRYKLIYKCVYRYKKLKEIAAQGYEIVLNPMFSREFFLSDNIVKLVNAKNKIGIDGDLSNIKNWQKNISDKYYTKLIKTRNNIIFEFNRNKEFFESFLHVKLNISKPFIKLKSKRLSFKLPERYAVLFIGAGHSFRKWDVEKFAIVGEYIKNKYNYGVILCGGLSDSEDAQKFREYFKDDYIDLVGNISLIDLVYVIKNGAVIITNETSCPHLAIALGIPNVFVISNGNHYGRFTPYPKEISQNYHGIYHSVIEQSLNNYNKLICKYGCGSNLDINEINEQNVINKIEFILNNQKMVHEKKIKISIITVCFNSSKYIETCIKSVISQTYKNIEYIIIDGGSEDGTKDIIQKYIHKITCWVSEHDSGIANAMNKGLAFASGDYILFLHSDDYLLSTDSIKIAVNNIDSKYDINAFNILYGNEKTSVELKSIPFSFKTFLKMPVRHQGAFCRKLIFDQIGEFDESFKTNMDYDFLLRAYQSGFSMKCIDFPLSFMGDTGISSKKDWSSLKARFAEEKKVHYKNINNPIMKYFYKFYWIVYPGYRYMKDCYKTLSKQDIQ